MSSLDTVLFFNGSNKDLDTVLKKNFPCTAVINAPFHIVIHKKKSLGSFLYSSVHNEWLDVFVHEVQYAILRAPV